MQQLMHGKNKNHYSNKRQTLPLPASLLTITTIKNNRDNYDNSSNCGGGDEDDDDIKI